MTTHPSEVFHLDLTRARLVGATLAILPGDPARVPRIAGIMDDPVPLASNREFNSHLAWIDDQPVVVCSTGIGGPSTSIAVEELAQLGVRTFLRVGTTGSIQPDLPAGHLIVTQAAVRLDGASGHFAPLEYPAASNFECTRALVDAAVSLGVDFRVGITASSDTFYPGQERYDTVAGAVTRHLRGSLDDWRQLGVLNYEMESATLFTMCATNGWRAGCVAGVIAHRTDAELPLDGQLIEDTEERAVAVVVEAARRLL
ncbi:MAG: uridine phosphorylase [Acidimicrobiia bacterium]|nr:uridine phosphorylase [Acidimicrobiia bacterium]